MTERLSEIHDISVELKEDMVVWPKDTPFRREMANEIDKGDVSNNSRLIMGCHNGTHIDAPRHFVADGISIEQLDLRALVGPARVVDCGEREAIDPDWLGSVDLGDFKRVLFKTRNSRLWADPVFHKDYTYLTADAATFLVDKGIRLVGIDYLSVGRYGKPGVETHRRFLRAEVVLLESLNLSDVPPGDYELMALPLKLVGSDGAPTRALLRPLP